MNSVYLTADLHLGHANIIKYDQLPFISVEQMDETIIKNWNNTVSKENTVFVLGDASFYNKEKTKEIISQLHGKKILIKGNHDCHNIQWWTETGFSEVSNYPIIYKEFYIFSHEPPAYFNHDSYQIHFYGHVHNTEMYKTITKTSACVCASRWNFTPVNIEKIIELIKAL